MRLFKFMLAGLLALACPASLAADSGLEELDSQQLEQQAVGNTLAPLAADRARQLDTLESLEEQQRHLPDAEYVARPDAPQLPVDTGVSAAQQQFLQSLIDTVGGVAQSAR